VPAIWIALQAALVSAAAPLTGGSAARRVAGALVLAAAFVLPWLSPHERLLRLVLASLALLGFLKNVEIASWRGARWTPPRRLWHLFSFFRVGRRRRRPTRLLLGVVLL